MSEALWLMCVGAWLVCTVLRQVLPILAAAIFIYRAKWLLQATEAAHVQRLLQDATGLRVVPLLQAFLHDPASLVDVAVG